MLVMFCAWFSSVFPCTCSNTPGHRQICATGTAPRPALLAVPFRHATLLCDLAPSSCNSPSTRLCPLLSSLSVEGGRCPGGSVLAAADGYYMVNV